MYSITPIQALMLTRAMDSLVWFKIRFSDRLLSV